MFICSYSYHFWSSMFFIVIAIFIHMFLFLFYDTLVFAYYSLVFMIYGVLCLVRIILLVHCTLLFSVLIS